MKLQLIEVYLPKKSMENFHQQLQDLSVVTHWHSDESEKYSLVRILVKASHSEEILNFLELNAEYNEEIKALLFNLQTYIPRIVEEKEQDEDTKDEPSPKAELIRASRHELYNVVHTSSEITYSFTWFLLLSAIVATVGIVKDSPAIVIGAMVIAPLIGPFTSAAFASVLGDFILMRQSVITSMYGLSIPLIIAAIFGFLFTLPANSQEFLSRTDIQIIDIAVALAAGAAGALSFIKRASEALVGVMVSVALLPPAIVLGMMVGAASWQNALTPLLLLLVNVNSIILSAILVFWLSGIKPVNWQEIKTANTSRKYSLIFVGVIILVLFTAIYLIKF
ncbi:TIGR00341 family protein [Sediminibacillus albus]|uniref:TIGR00341 family protein n=1 Tax=Sediminibacillus albus TaxID=407036 RepID=A0A1G9CD81_9BACI|nr:TIGR00341 family protein [Sediminibacillus albus]SDK49619.1 TIGR00341 family protein [Sediminibacillus albus]